MGRVVTDVVPTQSALVSNSQRRIVEISPPALVSAAFRLWEQEVPGGGSHRAPRFTESIATAMAYGNSLSGYPSAF
jgi:hypothetical protein